MIESKALSNNLVGGSNPFAGYGARKRSLKGVTEIQQLEIEPWTIIVKHKHIDEFEVWILLSENIACICAKGEAHQLVNESDKSVTIMAIKSCADYSYEDLEEYFKAFGFSVLRNSLTITKDKIVEQKL